MVEYGIHIRWEHRVVVVVDYNSRVCPPQEGLRERRAVVDSHFYFDVGLIGMQRKALHTLGTEHTLYLAAPHRNTAIGIVLDRIVGRQIGRRAVVLRPVKLNSARNPRSGKPHQCRFYDLIVVNEMAFFHLVVCHVDATAQLGQNHHLDIFVFEEKGVVGFLLLLIINFLYNRIGINRATTALINPLFEKDRIFLLCTYFIGRQHDFFLPGTHLAGSIYRTLD